MNTDAARDASRVSIVIPTFNAEATLERCLRSVLAQTWTDREIIVVDGASRDGTLAILARHREHLAQCVSAPDRGVYDAMNKGLALARGEWVYFLGSDDELYDAGVLRRVFDHALGDCDMVYGDVLMARDGSRYDGPFDLYKISRRNICHQAIFVRRAVFARVGPFSLDYPSWGDYEMNWRLFGDPAIRKRWVDVLVARYGATGRSSQGEDPVFQARRRTLRRELLRLSGSRYAWLRLRDKLRRLGR